jgi:hypothetical protein
MNKEESWICVDGHGDERIFPVKPHRNFPNMDLEVTWGQRWTANSVEPEYRRGVLLPKETIKYLIGKEMTYSDEPIKLK